MNFAAPIPFDEALDFAKRKQLLPTSLSSKDLSMLRGELKRRSVFSARLDRANVLDVLKKNLEEISGGGTDEFGRIRSITEAKAQLKESMQEAGILPAPAGTREIQDFYSDARRQLMVETNVLDTLNYGRHKATQDPIALDLNPAWELVRMVEPRGIPRNWKDRWMAARSETTEEGTTDPDQDGRMVALKNHPIWQALGDGAGGYEDTLGNAWPPFAFNSGMNVIDVSRDDAVELGLLEEDTVIPPDESLDMNENLEASVERFGEELVKALDKDASLEVSGGVLRLKNSMARKRIGSLVVLANAGTSDGAKKGWITRRAMGAMFDEARSGKTGSGKALAYRPVNDIEATRIRKATGLDVRGYRHALDASAVRHVVNQHGSAATETPRGQIPITRADVENLPRIIARADSVEYGGKSKGLDTIVYKKKEGGTLIVVEEVRTGRKQLALKSMRKIKNRAASNKAEAFPSLTSKTLRAALRNHNPAPVRRRLQALCASMRELGVAA